MNSESIKCGDIMQKTDKDGTLTKEYIDFVKGLEREDLERFYMGADLYNYDISNDNERLHNIINKAIKMLEESQKGLEEWHFDGYDPDLEYIIKILKGEDNDI